VPEPCQNPIRLASSGLLFEREQIPQVFEIRYFRMEQLEGLEPWTILRNQQVVVPFEVLRWATGSKRQVESPDSRGDLSFKERIVAEPALASVPKLSTQNCLPAAEAARLRASRARESYEAFSRVATAGPRQAPPSSNCERCFRHSGRRDLGGEHDLHTGGKHSWNFRRDLRTRTVLER
jgi:hypothetical protein